MSHAVATHADTVYVFGGRDKADLKSNWSCVAEVEQYNWHENRWTVLQARLARPRCDLAAACVSGNVYVIGGKIGKYYTESDVVEHFGTQTEQVSTAKPLPMDNLGMAALSITVVTVKKLKLNSRREVTSLESNEQVSKQ